MEIREHIHLPHRRYVTPEAELIGMRFEELTEAEQRTLEIESNISIAQDNMAQAHLLRKQAHGHDTEEALTADKIAKEAFSRVVELTHRNSFALAIATVGTNRREVAEEALSTAYASAYRALPSFRREAKFETWLYRIVKNKAHTFREREVRFERKHAVSLETDMNDDRMFVSPASTEKASMVQWQNEQVQKAINLLKEKDRQVVILRYVQEMPYEQIVDIMGGTENSLKVRCHRALKKLKVALNTFGIHEQADIA